MDCYTRSYNDPSYKYVVVSLELEVDRSRVVLGY